MINFDTLKAEWKNQEGLEPSKADYRSITSKLKTMKAKQRITNVVLFSTLGVLGFFFFYVSAFKNSSMTIGLLLMMGSLALRISLEFLSLKKLRSLNVFLDVDHFKTALTKYYKNRVKTHYLISPVIVLTYIAGFLILLPKFKMELSKGFYYYIIGSAAVVFLVLGSLILRQIRKELEILKNLQAWE